MKPITRDIITTLIIKFTLLTALWFVCFKHVDKSAINTQQWLLGSIHTNNLS